MKRDRSDRQGRAATGKRIRSRTRTAQIVGVFAKHNFYTNGFTPEELRTTLEDLGPTYVKIGQIMSSRTDMLPDSYCRELEKLRSDVQPLDAAVARAVIEQETGKKIEEIYAEFRDEPLGSASIAQAHYGVLLDGTRVVTKVQRPQVADMMRKDFVLLKKLAGAVNVAVSEDSGAVDLKSVVEELEKVTEDELDFRIEAENTRRFRELCIEDETRVSCPVIVDELTTERILTMTFVDGYSIAKKERVEADGYDRVEIGKAIVENYLHQVLDVGVFHGDPHQGNIMISGGVPYWIDFGMIGHISGKSVSTLQDVVFALVQKDVEQLTNAALTLGRPREKINKARLMDDVEGMIDRYMSAKKLTDIDVGALLTDMTALLAAHRIAVPGEYTMLIRSLVTIEGVLETFCPELNLFDFLTKKMLRRAREELDWREQLTSAVESLAVTGLKTVKLPSLAFSVLRNLSKGRMKIGFELTGYDDLLAKLGATVRSVVVAVFACVLFIGSCMLCSADLQPKTYGIPLAALIGFVVAVAMGIYSVISMTGKR